MASRDYDAVWLMDDDGFPHAEALTNLADTLDATALSCVCSLVVRDTDPTRFVWPLPRLDRNNLPVIFAWKRKMRSVAKLVRHVGGNIYPFAYPFNGSLLRLDAVQRVGSIETGFFTAGDELDFAMRLVKERSLASRLDAFHFHPDVTARPLTPRTLYFYVKNSLIVNRRYMNSPGLGRVLVVLAALGRTAQRNSLPFALSYILGPRVPILLRAIRRGLAGQVGNGFPDRPDASPVVTVTPVAALRPDVLVASSRP